MSTLAALRAKFSLLWPLLDERTRRLMAANEARSLDYGGVSLVSRACKLSRKTIHKGMREIEDGTRWQGGIRRPGAGRKAITATDPQLLDALEALVEDTTRGEPQSPLRWTVKSTRTLAATLTKVEHRLFSWISSNWRGEPLVDYETMVIGSPTPRRRKACA